MSAPGGAAGGRAESPAPAFVVIGHATHDLLPNGGVQLGGTALYAAITASRLGESTGVVTAAGDCAGIGAALPGVVLRCTAAPVTTTFINRYQRGRRTQHLCATASPINLDALPARWRSARVIHLGPVAQEIDPAALDALQPAWLCATPQGWLRRWRERDGRVSLFDLPPDTLARAPIRALMLSQSEERYLTALIGQVMARDGLVVITHGRRGATLLHRGERILVRAYRVAEVDPTGAGDVCAAAFFLRLARGDDPVDALRYACAAAGLSVTGPGIAAIPDDAEVRRLMTHT
jgi:sugar/nucleoside kinase (ribokinase family)